jgi:hypothetical protein
MHPIPELSPLLKQLRSSGILDSLGSRNREAIDVNRNNFVNSKSLQVLAGRDCSELD